MKLAEHTVEVQSNMQFDEVHKVGIADDDEAVKMVIERLISAYENPYRAALREYTSNAYDEHIAANVARPVEVNLPSELSPVLKVQDFGRGLTREELKGFGTIGKSTKRDSNDFTGGFGMGSKCALAAAPTFTVVSVKDGKRNTVVIARDENNIPHMNFLAETETDDGTGTTVIIPISDISKFGDLSSFWIGWKPGSLLVDDEEPKRSVYDEESFRPLRNGSSWYDLANGTGAGGTIRVLVNQVYYELDYKKLGLEYRQWNLLKFYVVKLDNGSVDIAPSRETLMYNARTNAAVAERMADVLEYASKTQADLVSQAPDIKTALVLLERMKKNGYPTDGIKWDGKNILLPGMSLKGNTIPDQSGTWCKPYRDVNTKYGWRTDKNYSLISNKYVWNFNGDSKFVIVHSADPATQMGSRRYRVAHREALGVAEWLSEYDNARSFFWEFFVTSEPLNRINRHYRDMANIVLSAEEFNAVVKKVRSVAAKAARDARQATKSTKLIKVMLPGWSRAVRERSIEDVKAESDYVIFLRNQDGGLGGRFRDSITTITHNNRTWNDTFRVLQEKYNATIIMINKNDKIDDMKALLPPAVTFQDLAVKAIEESKQQATVWDLMAVRDRAEESIGAFRALQDHHLEAIKNKDTVKWAKSLRDFQDLGEQARQQYEWLASYDKRVKEALADARLGPPKTLPVSPIQRYPLLRSVYLNSVKLTDVVDYVNLRDKALKKG